MHLLYSVSLKKALLFLSILLSFFVILTNKVQAATLSGASDTFTTSRPSPSSPLSANAAASSTQLSIFNNGSRYLASDSAKIIRTSTNAIINQNLVINSQSSALSTLFLGNTTAANSQNGTDVAYVPITAMHTIQFTAGQTLTTGDDIEITFPALTSGDANNPASPSATTFQLNNISTSEIKVEDDGANFTTFTATVTNPTPGTEPVISLNVNSGSIAIGSIVKIYLGCATWSGAACSVQAPRIINPTKDSTTSCTGSPETCTATSWKIVIDEIGPASNTNSATVGVGTIESVTVKATVDPTLSFSITGIINGLAVNTGNTTGCLDDETTNSGFNGGANEINLGILTNTPAANVKLANIAGQTINISTNATSGYALTATSSSSLINPNTGFFLRASTTPSSFPVSDDFFGVHACGQDVVSGFVETGASSVDCDTHVTTSTAVECRYAWPTVDASTSTSPLSIALDNVGPIGSGSSDAAGDGIISLSYAAGADVAVPPGEYRAIITYIATPSFQ